MNSSTSIEVEEQMLPEPTFIGITFYILGVVFKTIIGFLTLKFLRYWWNKWFKKRPENPDEEDEDIICRSRN